MTEKGIPAKVIPLDGLRLLMAALTSSAEMVGITKIITIVIIICLFMCSLNSLQEN
jgi:hypothetical protein